MTDGLVLTFAESRGPAARLARRTGLPFAEVEVHRFPDDEVRVRLPEHLPQRVIVLRSLDHPNEKLVELLLVAETARTLGARRVELVAPYLGYMRQDTAFQPGEAVSQRIVGAFLGEHFDRLVTVDPHLHRTHDLATVVPATEVCVLSATGPLADFIRDRFNAPLVVGPDAESHQWVCAIAERAHADYVVGSKERRGDADVEVTLAAGSFAGRDVVLVDDVVSTGRSLISAAAAILAEQPTSLSALATHGLFAGDARAELAAAGIANVWTTDSVPSEAGIVHLDRLLADTL